MFGQLTQFISFWDDLLDPLAITIDGDNKLIYVNPQYSTIRVKQDIYSASKRWLQRRQNSEYSPPVRSIGGDQVASGLYAGDIYFLTNNYQVVITTPVNVTGILYNDNISLSTYLVRSGGGVVSTVSSQAYAYNTTGVTVPTAQDVATQVWSSTPSGYATSSLAGLINSTSSQVGNIATTTTNILATTI